MFGYQLQKSPGYKKPRVQRGRGDSSGRGNYSGRGLKGQGSRTGSSTKPNFEGGQTPLVQRLPKLRGFKRYFKLVKKYKAVNIAALEKDDRITTGTTITPELLIELGYIKKTETAKILGHGDISKKLSFEGIKSFSETAKQKLGL